jgi:formate C-acetyltransferase
MAILCDEAVKTEDLYLSETIKYLVSIKDDIHDRTQIPHRDLVYRRVFAENPGDIEALKFAKAFAAFLREKKIYIGPRDILAGFTYRYTYDTTLPVKMPSDYDPLYRPPLASDSGREYETVLRHHGLAPDSKEAQDCAYFSPALTHGCTSIGFRPYPARV